MIKPLRFSSLVAQLLLAAFGVGVAFDGLAPALLQMKWVSRPLLVNQEIGETNSAVCTSHWRSKKGGLSLSLSRVSADGKVKIKEDRIFKFITFLFVCRMFVLLVQLCKCSII